MKKILVGSCLLGENIRYDGKNNLQSHPRLQDFVRAGRVIAICPEVAGGLSVPRAPAEIQLGRTAFDVLDGLAKVMTIDGVDVTAEYLAGAYSTLELIKKHDITVAILKARSLACGAKQVYDGSYSNSLVDGMGITAALLSQHGVSLFDETQIDLALDDVELELIR
ncbi:DUF523 domain-containing protein [bacterium]|nr:DUF523 domain-containing protein [bacterium]